MWFGKGEVQAQGNKGQVLGVEGFVRARSGRVGSGKDTVALEII
jgi:hypothetical protein